MGQANGSSRTGVALLLAAMALLGVAAPATASAATPIQTATTPPKATAQLRCAPGKKCVSLSRRTLPARRIGRFAFLLSTGKAIVRPKARRRARPATAPLEPQLNAIGVELAEIADGDPEGVFLYVEKGKGWMKSSVFKDNGNFVLYLESEDSDLEDRVNQAWLAEPEGRRWSVLEYAVHGGRFAATFRYSDEVDVETFDSSRLENALQDHFGNKPIVRVTREARETL